MDFDSLRLALGWMIKLVALTIVAYWLAQWLQKIKTQFQRLWTNLQHWQNWVSAPPPAMKHFTRLLWRWWLKS
jgi:hypothetical protein